MSMLSLGIKLLFRGSKLLSETAAEKAGVGDVAKLSIPFKSKIADLSSDQGLSLDYVNELVIQAKDEKSLKASCYHYVPYGFCYVIGFYAAFSISVILKLSVCPSVK